MFYFSVLLKWVLWSTIIVSSFGWVFLIGEGRDKDRLARIAGRLFLVVIGASIVLGVIKGLMNSVYAYTLRTEAEIESRELAQLTDTSWGGTEVNISGGLFGVSASFYSTNNQDYHFYARNERGAAEWHSLPAQGSEIHDFYPPDYVSRVVRIGVDYDCPESLPFPLNFLYQCIDDGEFHHFRWEFHVPKGTLVPNIVLDGQ